MSRRDPSYMVSTWRIGKVYVRTGTHIQVYTKMNMMAHTHTVGRSPERNVLHQAPTHNAYMVQPG
jgi:hypothetical protein